MCKRIHHLSCRMEVKTSHTTALVPLVLLLVGSVHALTVAPNRTAPLVPAVIVFGDSIVDTGNNNAISTWVKANFPPYGEDFDGGRPTGRFSNGRVPSDMIASSLGVKELMPAYLGTILEPEDILTGVSFASGGSGFDPLTPVLVAVLSMTHQLELFKEYKELLKGVAGEERAASIISESMYIVCAGSDDLANTYYGGSYRNSTYDIPSYVSLMSTSASSFIQQLYQLGARRIGFVGLPPIGCLPSQRNAAGDQRHCDPPRNAAASLFNSKFITEIKRLQSELKGSRIVYLDIYSIMIVLAHRPSIYGFVESTKGCCGTGKSEASITCNSLQTSTCSDDTKYVFWDSFHPTERAYQIVVDDIMKRDIQHLLG